MQAARGMGHLLAGIGAVVPVTNMPANIPLGACEATIQAPPSMMLMYAPKDQNPKSTFAQFDNDDRVSIAQPISALANPSRVLSSSNPL